MTENIGDTLSSGDDESSGYTNRDPSPEPSRDEPGRRNDLYRNNELYNDRAMLGEDDGRPCTAKRKRRSSSDDGPM
jgi:hypothetical protein